MMGVNVVENTEIEVDIGFLLFLQHKMENACVSLMTVLEWW